MKLKKTKLFIFLLLLISASFLSCQDENENKIETVAKAQITTSTIQKGYLPDNIKLTGKTIYLNKSSLVSPINGYVTKVNIQQGDKISKNDLLFEIQTPEAFAMQQKDSSARVYGIISIYAPANGRIVNLNVVNKGVYIDKGSEMCKLLSSNDLKLQVNVPLEYNKWAKIGRRCSVVLPDGTVSTAVFTKILPQIDEASQTTKVLANLNSTQFMPENMIVSVLVDKSEEHQAQILPKTCLQTDALMHQFWVMKLINDSTAIQTFVKIGNQTDKQVEILSPLFDSTNLFIQEGAYGLSDTVSINIVR